MGKEKKAARWGQAGEDEWSPRRPKEVLSISPVAPVAAALKVYDEAAYAKVWKALGPEGTAGAELAVSD